MTLHDIYLLLRKYLYQQFRFLQQYKDNTNMYLVYLPHKFRDFLLEFYIEEFRIEKDQITVWYKVTWWSFWHGSPIDFMKVWEETESIPGTELIQEAFLFNLDIFSDGRHELVLKLN